MSAHTTLSARQHVEQLDGIEQVSRLASEWRELMSVTPSATFFHSADWLQVYWRHFGGEANRRFSLLTVRDDDGNLCGLVPLVRQTVTRALGRVTSVTLPLDDWGSFFGPLGSDPAALLQQTVRHLLQDATGVWGRWGLLSIPWCRDSEITALQEQASELGITAEVQQRTEASLVDLSSGYDDYQRNQWSSKFRSNLRRCRRRLEEAGELQYDHFRPEAGTRDARFDLYDACEQVCFASWQSTSETGLSMVHSQCREFLRDVHQVAVSCGAVDLHLLRLDNQPIAFAYNYRGPESVFGLRSGYHPEFARFSVGNLLYAQALESAANCGDRNYDLGPGYSECKTRFATDVVPVMQWNYYPGNTAWGQLHRLRHWLRTRS